jgi:perosamine synthetase
MTSSTWKIPHSQPTLGESEARAAAQTVLSGFVGSGAQVRAFERAVAATTGRTFATATTSGSAALQLAFLALGIGASDQIILPALICRAVLNVILALRAEPVLVDIELSDLTLSFDAARAAITRRTKAILLPHMFGAPAAVDKLGRLGVPIVEDAASSLGAQLQGKAVGGFGIVSILSFASTKMITTGQGGMLLTDDAAVADKVERLADYDGAYHGADVAYNVQLTDVPASIGLAQMSRLKSFVDARRAIAKKYDSALADVKGIVLPRAREGGEHSYYRYVLRIEDDAHTVASAIQAQGIDARTSVAHFLYDYLDQPLANFPNCEAVRHRTISLPIYPGVDAGFVAQSSRSILAHRESRAFSGVRSP